MKKAIAYIRVSSEDQMKNFSLPTQGRLCCEYCERNGWEIVLVFIEWGESAQTADRSTLQDLLKYCRQRKNQINYAVVYRVDRFARCAKDHAVVEAMLNSYGTQLRSVTEPIDESNTGRLMGTILSGMAEFDNRVRADRTKTGLKEAVDHGRWPFRPTLGYLSARDAANEPLIVVDPVRGPLIKRAFELFATGLYTDLQVRKEVTKLGLRTRKGSIICRQHLADVLRNPFYAGWLVVGPWAGRKRGNFPALIDQQTFDRVQGVLKGILPKTTPEALNRPEFPLRRYAKCGKCGARMTAAWVRGGMNRRYPYYSCSEQCRGMGIRAEELERQFLEILDRVRMKPEVVVLFQSMVGDCWRQKHNDVREMATAARRRLTELEGHRQRLVEAFIYKQAISEEVFKQESSRLESEIVGASVEATVAADDLDMNAVLDFAGEIILNAAEIWRKLSLDQKQRFQKVLIPDGIVVGEDKAVRTDATSSGFSLLQLDSSEKATTACLRCDSWNEILNWLRQIDQFRQILNELPAAA